ncbi:YIP1 family protein [Pueribacillus theae]|uniref:YIP1 family protein n=1 Tax=Pueribacillus theae TaxID=2171751 RepID=A0A2U1K5F3_9BACI|nr:Yip1 family protein [Pueribacillus theae]PWA12188.1 YIP1 family protein [Pueribacillus theae]
MSEETKIEKPSLFGMIWSPSEQFERIKQRPKIWGAMVVVTILTIIGMWLQTLGVDIPELDGMPEDQLAGIQVFTTITTIVMGLFIPIIGVLISSAIHLLIAKIARSEVSFKQLFSMNTYIMIISALSLLINGILMALVGGDPEKLLTSLGSIINVEGAMGGLFNSLEVFTIWEVILTAMGLHKVANFSKGLAWTIAIAFFVIAVIFSMIGTAFSGMAGV